MPNRLVSAAFSLMVMLVVAHGAHGQGASSDVHAATAQRHCLQPTTASEKVLISAMALVLGEPAKFDCKDIENWHATMAKEPYNMNADKFLRVMVAQPDMLALRAQVIDNAYLEVYGRPASAVEITEWEPQVNSQKAWYSTIRTAGIKRLNSSEDERLAMVNRAYQEAFGRDANDMDRGYWVPRPQHFRQIVEANRVWLYLPHGFHDLQQIIVRSFTIKNGKAPTNDIIKNLISDYLGRSSNPIYSEMIR